MWPAIHGTCHSCLICACPNTQYLHDQQAMILLRDCHIQTHTITKAGSASYTYKSRYIHLIIHLRVFLGSQNGVEVITAEWADEVWAKFIYIDIKTTTTTTKNNKQLQWERHWSEKLNILMVKIRFIFWADRLYSHAPRHWYDFLPLLSIYFARFHHSYVSQEKKLP